MPIKALTNFLDEHNIKYLTVRHSSAYTAQEVAASAHIPGKELAKTVMVKLDGKMAMAVLRATDKVDLDALRSVAGSRSAELAAEDEFTTLFPGVEAGAMPPFGNLYDIDVYVDGALTQYERIAFNAGNHVELFQLAYRDYERLVKPHVTNFSR